MKTKDKRHYTTKEILDCCPHEISGINLEIELRINDFSPILQCTDNSLGFIDKNRLDKLLLIGKSNSRFIVLTPTEAGLLKEYSDRVFLFSDDPKLTFSQIVNNLLSEKKEGHIHQSAIVDSEARIHESVYIGPNCVVGKVSIGPNSMLLGNNFLFDDTVIGEDVRINPGTVIGTEGFGYNRDQNGVPVQFPHLGGVTIGNRVQIGANVCIDRGALSNTIIEDDVVIDNFVHVAHNVVIREKAFIVAHAMIGGSTTVLAGAYIGPSSALRDQITIGSNSLVGMSASVIKSIKDNEVWTGNPAREFSQVKKINDMLNKIQND